MALHRAVVAVVVLSLAFGLAIATALAQGQTPEPKISPSQVQECQRLATALITSIRARRLTLEVRNRLDAMAASLQVQCAVGRFSEAAKTVEAMRNGLDR